MSWPVLVGHEDVLVQLRRALVRGRLGHAFLFVGPEGIGKRRTARHVAQGMLCETRNAVELDPCGKCAGCLQVESGSHPDFFEIVRPSDKHEMPLESVQTLCGQLSMKPARGRYKIAIVDDADDLTTEAANCFLKTLEEPPRGSILILIATSPETQLATIVSRCQIIRFRELGPPEVASLLLAQGAVPDQSQAEKVATFASGSVGRAMLWLNEEYQVLRSRLARGLSELPAGAIELAADIQKFIEAAGKESAPKRARARDVIRLAADFFTDVMRRQEGALQGELPDAEQTALTAAAERFPNELLLDFIDRCLLADYHINRFLSHAVSIDCWVDDLAQIASGELV